MRHLCPYISIQKVYHPITLFPLFGNILKKLLLRIIHQFISLHNLLSGKKHGFLQTKSKDIALQSAQSYIDLNKNKFNYTSFISLDFMGAFDNLPWDIVILAQQRLRIPNQFIKTIAFLLSGRRALVEWQIQSLLYYFSKGCPQVFCLCPFVWLVLLDTLLALFVIEFCELVAYVDEVILGDNTRTLRTLGLSCIKIYTKLG